MHNFFIYQSEMPSIVIIKLLKCSTVILKFSGIWRHRPTNCSVHQVIDSRFAPKLSCKWSRHMEVWEYVLPCLIYDIEQWTLWEEIKVGTSDRKSIKRQKTMEKNDNSMVVCCCQLSSRKVDQCISKSYAHFKIWQSTRPRTGIYILLQLHQRN